MSTLTKVLIVLLSVASIFLCGIVATYVATADNYMNLNATAQFDLNKARGDVKKMEADVLRDIVFSGKRPATASKQQTPRPSDEHDDMKLSIRDLFDLSLFFGSSWLLSENERLKTENEELRKIVNNIKSQEKPSPDNGLSTKKHEGTL